MYYTREYLNRAHREIDTIFRVLFPEHGMAVREEQIMLCYEMFDNLLGRNIALCDAGVGIGKTYAYLVACVLTVSYTHLYNPVIMVLLQMQYILLILMEKVFQHTSGFFQLVSDPLRNLLF